MLMNKTDVIFFGVDVMETYVCKFFLDNVQNIDVNSYYILHTNYINLKHILNIYLNIYQFLLSVKAFSKTRVIHNAEFTTIQFLN